MPPEHSFSVTLLKLTLPGDIANFPLLPLRFSLIEAASNEATGAGWACPNASIDAAAIMVRMTAETVFDVMLFIVC